MRTKLNQIIKFVDNIGDDIGGFRYEFTFYCTHSLSACYDMIAQHPTIDGVPEELDIEQRISPEMYRTNVKDAIKTALPYISRGGTNYSPNRTQKKVMVELLNALGFFSER